MQLVVSGTSSVVAVLVTVTLFAASAPGTWAVPANDNCTDAYDFGIVTSASNISYSNDWSGATWEGHEGCGSETVTMDLWHTFVANETGIMRADLCKSNCWGLEVSVYDFDIGSCASLTSADLGVVDCGVPRGCGGCDGMVTFHVVAGKTYMIRVWFSGVGPSFSNMYALRLRYGTPPSNDDCVNHIAIDTNVTSPVTNNFATGEHYFCSLQDDETDPDTWYSFSVPAGAFVTLSLCGSSDYYPALTMLPGPPDEVCGDPVNSEFVCSYSNRGIDFICHEEVDPCIYTLRMAGRNGGTGTSAVCFDIRSPAYIKFQPGSGSGVWSDASAYDGNAVPSSGDFLTLMPATTLTLDVDATIAYLELLDDATLHIPAARTLTITEMLSHPAGQRPRCFIIIEGTLVIAEEVVLGTTCDVIVRDGTWQFSTYGYPRYSTAEVGELHVNWPGALVFEGNGTSTVTTMSGLVLLNVAAISWTEGSIYVHGLIRLNGYQRVSNPREAMPPEPSFVRRTNITRASDDVSVRTWTSSGNSYVKLHLLGNATVLVDWNGVFSLPPTGSCVDMDTYAGTLTLAPGTTLQCHGSTQSSVSLLAYTIGASTDFPLGGIVLKRGSVLDVRKLSVSHGAIIGDGMVKYTSSSTWLSTRAGLSPGRPGSSQRHLVINGRTDKHWNTYRFHLGGTEPGISHSLVDFHDDMDIDGKTVTVTIDPGYQPDEGQEFTVMRTNGTFTGVLNTSVNGTLMSECASVVPVYPTGEFKELKVRVDEVHCCGITTCGQCTQRADCAWCPDPSRGAGMCYAAEASDSAVCYTNGFRCNISIVAQAVALAVLVLSFSLALYVYVRSRLTSRRAVKKNASLINAQLDGVSLE